MDRYATFCQIISKTFYLLNILKSLEVTLFHFSLCSPWDHFLLFVLADLLLNKHKKKELKKYADKINYIL